MTKVLSESQLAELARLLDTRYDSLLREVREELASSEDQQYVELIGRVPADSGDQSVADELADLNVAIVDRHVREMRDLDAARARTKDGTFGICVDCGECVGFERLRAYPTAKRCIACQQRREKAYAHGGTPTL
jgi:RNA polymerase-binding protein DksA